MITQLDEREFVTCVNEELIQMGLPEGELIDIQMAVKYMANNYTVNMAINDVVEAWMI